MSLGVAQEINTYEAHGVIPVSLGFMPLGVAQYPVIY